MKTVFLTLLSLLCITGLWGQNISDSGSPSSGTNANPEAIDVVLNTSTQQACAGDLVTAQIEAAENNLFSDTLGANGNKGIMFDVSAAYDAIITGFETMVNPGTSTFHVYYKTGSHVGFETNSSAWTFLDSITNISGTGNLKKVSNELNLSIVAGQTLAFYVTSSGTSSGVKYSNGTTTGTLQSSDAFLSIYEGTGKGFPFAASNANRNFNGNVLYKPAISSVVWQDGSTSMAITESPTQSKVYSADVTLSNGNAYSRHAFVQLVDLEVSNSPMDTTLCGGNNGLTISGNLALDNALMSTYDAGNNQNGAMFDLEAIRDLSITGFDVFPLDTATVEIYYKSGTHVGSEGTAGDWTLIGSAMVYPHEGAPVNVAVNANITAGQTAAFYITTNNAADKVYYSNGTSLGAVFNADANLQIKEGVGVEYPFGTTYSPRVLNATVHYHTDSPAAATYNWSSGGVSGSINVTPSVSTNYDLTASLMGCSEVATTTVTVSGCSAVEALEDRYNIQVFPNPANDYINLSMENIEAVELMQVVLTDAQGRVLHNIVVDPSSDRFNQRIDLNDLNAGFYILSIQTEKEVISYKLSVMK